MKSVIVRRGGPRAVLAVAEAPEPLPAANDALVAVHSVSLNRGEITHALERAQDGWAPGWDFAGTVVARPSTAAGPRWASASPA